MASMSSEQILEAMQAGAKLYRRVRVWRFGALRPKMRCYLTNPDGTRIVVQSSAIQSLTGRKLIREFRWQAGEADYLLPGESPGKYVR